MAELTMNGVTVRSEQMYSADEAAKALNLSPKTLSTYRSRVPGAGKALPYCKPGSQVYYRGSDLIAHFQTSMREPGADPQRSERARERIAKRHRKQGDAN